MSQPVESALPTKPQVALSAHGQAPLGIILCVQPEILRTQGALQVHAEVASERVWSEGERMRDLGSQICVPTLVKPSLDTSVVFVLLPIYLFHFAARASVNPSVGTLSGTCEQMQPSCTHSHKGT